MNKLKLFTLLMVLLLLLAACGQAAEPTAVPATTAASAVEENTAVDATAATNAKLNLNETTGDTLQSTIPDFSDRMVREFMEYRPYISIEQFRREIGKYVDDAQVSEYEQYVFVPVNVDESDAATLMQIPGVDQAMAEALMAKRPFNTNDAFLTELGTLLTPEEVAVAATYLQP